jgi:hypothetical protein
MKIIRFITGLLVLFSLTIILETCQSQKKENKLYLKATLKSAYTQISKCDSSYYLLINLQLINNTDSTCTFLASCCNLEFNFLVDSKLIKICSNNCSANFPIPYSLKPSQIFSIPILLQIRLKDSYGIKQFRTGQVMLNPNTSHLDFNERIRNMKKNSINIIWSNEIQLTVANNQQYSIE